MYYYFFWRILVVAKRAKKVFFEEKNHFLPLVVKNTPTLFSIDTQDVITLFHLF